MKRFHISEEEFDKITYLSRESNEPRREKTGLLPMRKQRFRSAVQ